MPIDKRFIEESFPVKEVSQESAREKNIRHGHISTLHIWWARRPLAASRATNYAALIPAISPQENPDEWQKKRDFIIELCKWENSNRKDLLERARKDILEANGGKPPKVLDPFAGEISDLTRFYVLWRWEYGAIKAPFDEARKLAASCAIDLAHEWHRRGFIQKEKEFIRVLGPHQRDHPRLMRDKNSTEPIDILHQALLLWEKSRREKMLSLLCKKAAAVTIGGSTLSAQTMAFMQELTETVSTMQKVCLVATLPASIIEHYDESAEKLFQQLQKVSGRHARQRISRALSGFLSIGVRTGKFHTHAQARFSLWLYIEGWRTRIDR